MLQKLLVALVALIALVMLGLGLNFMFNPLTMAAQFALVPAGSRCGTWQWRC